MLNSLACQENATLFYECLLCSIASQTSPYIIKSVEGDKVSMLTSIYPHKPLRKWPYAITRLTAHFVYGLMSDLVICKFWKSMITHDTECPYWDQVSLNNTNQTKPLQIILLLCSIASQTSPPYKSIIAHWSSARIARKAINIPPCHPPTQFNMP